MDNRELKRIWRTLATQNLIEKDLAKATILEIISAEGYGVLGKIEKKLRFDYKGYLVIVIFIPLLALFVGYHDSLYPNSKTIAELGRQYTILLLFEAFMIYALLTVKRNMNFISHTANNGSLKESLLNVKSYFQSITKTGYWTGTLSLMAILSFVLYDVLTQLGGIENLDFALRESVSYKSYLSVFLLLLILSIPLIVKLEADKYGSVLHDLDQSIAELTEEE